MKDIDKTHPEYYCDRCGHENVSWHTSNALWNMVTGHPAGLVLCPRCFEDAAFERGISMHFIGKDEL